jgi:hypothetical protein
MGVSIAVWKVDPAGLCVARTHEAVAGEGHRDRQTEGIVRMLPSRSGTVSADALSQVENAGTRSGIPFAGMSWITLPDALGPFARQAPSDARRVAQERDGMTTERGRAIGVLAGSARAVLPTPAECLRHAAYNVCAQGATPLSAVLAGFHTDRTNPLVRTKQ